MLTAAIYARYSSDLQRATSIADQERVCRDAAPRFECTVLDDHVHTDEELSGATGLRPGYQRLLAAAKAHKFDAILVESQDRLWRNQGEMHHALERLAFWGVRVFSVATGTDLTAGPGRLVASVMGWKDEAFLADLRDKTRRGMLGQIRRGLSAGGRAYGYRNEPVVDEAGRVVGHRRRIESTEAAQVRRIFDLYCGGTSPKTIARRLNAEGVPPPRWRSGVPPRGWTWTTISGSPKRTIGILNNPLYAGRLVWNRSRKVRDPDTGKRVMRARPPEEWVWTDAPELRIVPEDLWERAAARRQGRRLTARGNLRGRRPKYPFSGLLVCAECGAHYVVKSGAYYGCAANTNRGPAICRNGRQVRRTAVERILLRAIFEEVFSPEVVAHVARRVEKAVARLTASPDDQRQRFRDELAQARGELENIAAAIRQGIVTPTTRAMLEDAERRVGELEARLAAPATGEKTAPPLEATVASYLRDLRGTLETDPDEARRLLSVLVGQIPLRREGRHLVAEVRGNLPALLGEGDLCDKAGAGRGI